MSQFRPMSGSSQPPKNTTLLVRFKPRSVVTLPGIDVPEADEHRVFPAVALYEQNPLKEGEEVFTGFILLLPPSCSGHVTYTYARVRWFDGWMPCPE